MKKVIPKTLRSVVAMNVLMLTLSPVALLAQSLSPANTYRQHIGEPVIEATFPRNESSSSVKTGRRDFFDALTSRANGRPLNITEIVGFSGARYSDPEKLKSDLRSLFTSQAVAGNPATANVIILGATTDGIGVGYEVIEELKQRGLVHNVITAGVVSEQAVKYPDSIARQNVLFLVESFRAENGSQSWEVRTTPTSSSETVNVLTDIQGRATVRMVVLEGGAVALNEGIELLIEQRNREGRVEMILSVGYEAGRPSKDQGPRAASQIALLVEKYPNLLPSNVDLRINIVSTGETVTLTEFFQREEGRRLKQRAGNTANLIAGERLRLVEARASGNTSAIEVVQARINQLTALERTGQVYLEALNMQSNRINATAEGLRHVYVQDRISAESEAKWNRIYAGQLAEVENLRRSVRSDLARGNDRIFRSAGEMRALEAAQIERARATGVSAEEAVRAGRRR